ncbi:MAG: hypothetical protein HZA61_03465 [Candidatus Eisenbacteria bacterium]|uniref:FlgD/Vpr Ig-like domain-containing protein n=1 Tax=Eiseniibacteriota bacterium TaxID=2212470 RepID=A0A933S9N0_UNCEI|nr:hypothetical protein [Candidatus Eisenbacteria bacterium]
MALLFSSVGPRFASAAIQVALSPALQTVAPGGEFDVRIEIPSSGSAFNAYEVVVQYDPAALTFLPKSPTTLQQGALMLGGCAPASTFHLFTAGGDSLRVTNSLLCNGGSLTGPGNLYTLRFRASNTPQVTSLSVRFKEFFSAGLLVTPVSATGCQVGIGIPLDVPARESGALRVQAEPNPAWGSVRLTIGGDVAGPRDVDVLDVSGRAVRHLARGLNAPSGGTSLVWNGTTDSGARVPAGIYLVRVRSGAETRFTRIAWLP